MISDDQSFAGHLRWRMNYLDNMQLVSNPRRRVLWHTSDRDVAIWILLYVFYNGNHSQMANISDLRKVVMIICTSDVPYILLYNIPTISM